MSVASHLHKQIEQYTYHFGHRPRAIAMPDYLLGALKAEYEGLGLVFPGELPGEGITVPGQIGRFDGIPVISSDSVLVVREPRGGQ